jgi:hypothetical protein
MLAVATEQGSVHIMNTSKRNDWDFGVYLITPIFLLAQITE